MERRPRSRASKPRSLLAEVGVPAVHGGIAGVVAALLHLAVAGPLFGLLSDQDAPLAATLIVLVGAAQIGAMVGLALPLLKLGLADESA